MAVLSSLRKAEAGLARSRSPQQQKFPRASKGRPGGGGEAEGRRRGGNGSKNTYQPYLLSKETTPKRKTYIKSVIEE